MSSLSVEDAIDAFLTEISSDTHITVALSGGKDSIALLHALQNKTDHSRLQAIYVNHQLQPEADNWGKFCQTFCETHGVAFTEVLIEIFNTHRKGLEAVARDKRYQALFERIPENGLLVTGHHLQDQSETVLLNLFRGTGLTGLKGMSYCRSALNQKKFFKHCRPLLKVDPKTIATYLQFHELDWIEDQSNQDNHFNRNHIRNCILPLVHEKWPKAEKAIGQMTETVHEALVLLDRLAIEDLSKVFSSCFSLDLVKVQHLGWDRQKNMIRYWLSQNFPNLTFNRSIFSWLQQVLTSCTVNAHPTRKLSDVIEIRVEGQKIYVLVAFQSSYLFENLNQDLEFLHFDESLLLDQSLISRYSLQGMVVRSVSPQDFARFPGLRKWLKSQGIVYWNRQRWPMIEHQGKVVEIPGFYINESFYEGRSN